MEMSRRDFETDPEHILTSDEVHQEFKELIKKEYEFVREIKNGDGLCYMEVTAPGESGKEINLYTYMRKGRYITEGPDNKPQRNESAETEIHVVYFEDENAFKNNEPCGGDIVAKYADGEWKKLNS